MIVRKRTRKQAERYMKQTEPQGKTKVLFEFKVRRDSRWIDDLKRKIQMPGVPGLRMEVETDEQRERRLHGDRGGEKILDLGGNGLIDVGAAIEQLLGCGFRPTDAYLFDKADDYMYVRLSMEESADEKLDYQTFCLVEEFANKSFRYMQMYRNEDNVVLTPTILARGNTGEIVELKLDDAGVYDAGTHKIE